MILFTFLPSADASRDSCFMAEHFLSLLGLAPLQALKMCRQQVSEELGMPEVDLELSMGTVGDFKQAVRRSFQ